MKDYSDADFNALDAKYSKRADASKRPAILEGMYQRLARAHRSRGNEAAAESADMAARKAANLNR